ncbi:MAG: hypothetical protein ACREEM_43300 [Blastocatellia bacterium]
MNNALPSDLLKLKAQFESWRRTREKKGPIPDHLRKAAMALLDRHAATTICRVCRLHPRTLQEPAVSKRAYKAPAKMPDFFPLPALPQDALSFSPRQPHADCQLLLERPDGARLTLTLPAIDPASLSALCSNFLRSSIQ